MAKFLHPLATQAITLECAGYLGRPAQEFLRWLAGHDLRDGLLVRFGWAVLRIQAVAGGWQVFEPDIGGKGSRQWGADVTRSLSILVQQLDLLRKTGLPPVDVACDDRLILASGAVDAAESYLTRSPPTPGDSGWFVGVPGLRLDRLEPGQLEVREVHVLWRLRRTLLPWLVLPPGTRIHLTNGLVRQAFAPDGRPLPT